MIETISIIGALKKGKEKATYLFCKYTRSALESDEIDDLLLITATPLAKEQIEVVVVEERDERQSIIGIRFRTHSGDSKNVFIRGYEDIDDYLNEWVS